MSKLKLAFLAYRSDPFSGGQGIYLKNVTEALLERGHQITIYSGRPLPDVSDDIDLIPIETPGYFESFDFNQRFKNFLKQSKTSMEILDFFETCTGTFTEPIFFGDRLLKNDHFIKHQDSFDIFHDNQSLSNYSKIINNRLVTTLHHPIHVDRDIDLENEPGFLRRFAIKRWYSFLNFQKKNVKNIKAIVSPSESSKRDIVKFFDCSESKIKVIWNGVDITTPEQNNQKEFKNHFVTIVSADVPMKNLENILNSLFLIPVRLRKFFLLIIYFLSLSNYGCYATEKWITVYSGRKDYLDRGSKKIDVDSIKKSSDGYVFYIIRREVGTHSRFNSSPDGGILYTASNWGAVSCENRTIFTQIKAGSVYGKKIGLKGEEFIFKFVPSIVKEELSVSPIPLTKEYV